MFFSLQKLFYSDAAIQNLENDKRRGAKCGNRFSIDVVVII